LRSILNHGGEKREIGQPNPFNAAHAECAEIAEEIRVCQELLCGLCGLLRALCVEKGSADG